MKSREVTAPRWYLLDHLLAVEAGAFAFILGEKGWGAICPHILRHEALPFRNGREAIDSQVLCWAGLDEESIAACVRFGIAPPRPKRIRRWVCIEQVQTIGGSNDFEGKIYAESDDGAMWPVNGKELAALARIAPNIKSWRLHGRPDCHTG